MSKSKKTPADVAGRILAGKPFTHDIDTRVELHPISVEQQEEDAELVALIFAAPECPIDHETEKVIFEIAAKLALRASKRRGVSDPNFTDRFLYNIAAGLVRIPEVSHLTQFQIDDYISFLTHRVLAG